MNFSLYKSDGRIIFIKKCCMEGIVRWMEVVALLIFFNIAFFGLFVKGKPKSIVVFSREE